MLPSPAARVSQNRAAQAKAAQEVRKALEPEVDPWAGIDVLMEHAGHKIVLPEFPLPMGYDVAIETLRRRHEEEEQIVAIHETVDAYPMDGAVAFQKAMREQFGWTSAIPTPGFFGPEPPQTIEVDIGPNPEDKMSVVWGRFELPGIDGGYVESGMYDTVKGPRFRIGGAIKRKHHGIIRDLAKLTRRIAAEESIYRNKAIKFTILENGMVDWNQGITFSDLSGINPDELVFSEITEIQIKTSLWTMIEQTDRCRLHQVPLKRGVLMTGKYGTGKSLTSAVTAKKAIASKEWTFLSISRVSGLKDAINFGYKFQPCVIFAEDIDRVVSGQDRTVSIDDILNTIDGIESKGAEIMVVMTTNEVENITKAMLRPGRLDAIIEITPPDAPAVKRLVRLYGRSLLASDDSLEKCAEALAGQIPAMIRECTERAKLYAIGRSESDDDLRITDDDILNAAIGMRAHMDLLEGPVEVKRDLSLREMVEAGIGDGVRALLGMDQSIIRHVHNVEGRVQSVQTGVDRLVMGGSSVIVQTIQETLDESFRKNIGELRRGVR